MKKTWKPCLLAAMSLAVPLGESLAGTADFTVQYQNYNASGPNDSIIEAGIQLKNNTTAAIPLSTVVVRYWFTKDGATTVTPACWWWNTAACPGLSLATGSVSATGADQYVEVRFTSAAGSLAAGASTVPIDLGITFGGAAVNETDDYSYGNQTALTAWSRISVHDVGSAPTGGLRGGTPPSGGTTPPTVAAEFFDDFTYTGPGDAAFTNLWTVRTYAGGPGVEGAAWSASNVSMVSEGSNRLMRLQASTNGSVAGTSHSEVLTKAQKFKFGTYSTRIKFRDTPLSGPRVFGDKYVETFFALTPYSSPSYSEQDYEYLPNGGWGQGNTPTMFLTSFDKNKTASPERKLNYSHDGWHTLVLHSTPSGNVYHIDGVQQASHTAQFAPLINQFLDFQMWFIELGTTDGTPRTYFEEVDWVYFAKDTYLDTNAVNAKVTSLRNASVARKDTVP
ncbi:cellulose binding domain-containing protein [Stigmatella sp. ncwal1]|uniref:Cellulose binding domain-containing protein n=1 Tax=Stigmatella ashevillensis TaxID=2995309 RepID=A0ABT5DH29_9BACT|nr:cellulose binding domain-containing protein [Stigmatella ashevillena]MDC0712430.1 cellulose binding domain-containing protein [Stigmatella ashevillena]